MPKFGRAIIFAIAKNLPGIGENLEGIWDLGLRIYSYNIIIEIYTVDKDKTPSLKELFDANSDFLNLISLIYASNSMKVLL